MDFSIQCLYAVVRTQASTLDGAPMATDIAGTPNVNNRVKIGGWNESLYTVVRSRPVD